MKRQRLAGIEKEISRVISSVLLSEIKILIFEVWFP